MNLVSFSHWLEEVTDPRPPLHPYYHPVQIAICGSLSYIGTACLTSVPPKRAMLLTALVYTISQIITPLICPYFEPYQDISLVPLIGQVIQLTTSLLLAKVICRLVGQSLSFKDIQKVSLAFMVALCVAHFTLLKFRRHLYGT